jgi:hypothetical protein
VAEAVLRSHVVGTALGPGTDVMIF